MMLVQLITLKENGRLSLPAGCTSDCNDKARKCFNRMKSFTVKAPNLPTVTDVTQDTWHFCVDAWRQHTRNTTIPDCIILTTYGICPASVPTAFSYTMMELYQAYRPSRAYANVRDYYAEPSLMVQGFNVIESARAKIGEYIQATEAVE